MDASVQTIKFYLPFSSGGMMSAKRYRGGLWVAVIIFSLMMHAKAGVTTRKMFIDSPPQLTQFAILQTRDIIRYRHVRLNTTALLDDQAQPVLRVDDVMIVNLFEDVADTVRIDKIMQHKPAVTTLRGRMDSSPMGTFLYTFENGILTGLHVVPEAKRQYRILYDQTAQLYSIKQMHPEALDELPDGPVLLPREMPFHKPTSEVHPERDTALSHQSRANQVIDLLIVYTPAARQWADENAGGINTVIAQAMSLAQTALDNSQIAIQLNLVYTAEVAYNESGNSVTDLERLTYFDNQMDIVHTWRDEYGADLVSIFTRCNDVGGIGWLLTTPSGDESHAFCLSRVQQVPWSYTMIHEIGHNLGAHHRKDQTVQPGPGLYPYSAGWRWIGQSGNRYASVMSYTESWDGEPVFRVGYFSSPLLIHDGVQAGDEVDADNTRGINQIAPVIANYRMRPIIAHPTISGYVRDIYGNGQAGVTLLANNGGGSVQTDGDGLYRLQFDHNWSGRVTPTKTASSFVPSFREYSSLHTNLENQDYTLYFHQDQLRVVVPNGNEKWKQKQQHLITWTSTLNDARVYVDLYANDQFFRRLKSNGTANDGTYTWDIGEDIPVGSHYKIRISGTTSGIMDESDGYFTIAAAPEPEVPQLIYPDNGLAGVSTMPRLNWSAQAGAIFWLQVAEYISFDDPVIEDDTLFASHFNVPAWVLEPNTTYYWRVAAILEGVQSSWSETFQFTTGSVDDSENLFVSNLSPQHYRLRWVEPLEKYYIDRNYQITALPAELNKLLWICTANDDKKSTSEKQIQFFLKQPAKIYVAYDARALSYPAWMNDYTKTPYAIHTTDVKGVFEVWELKVPVGQVTLGGNLREPAMGARSNYVVLLKPEEPPQITILRPNSDDIWQCESIQAIVWLNSGPVGANVKMDLFKSGIFYQHITSDIPNIGSYSWLVPPDLPESSEYSICISSLIDEQISANSQQFTIRPRPRIVIDAPAAGTVWRKGTPQEILWHLYGNTGSHVTIELLEGGRLAKLIVAETENSGRFAWTIPDTIADGSGYTIRVTSTLSDTIRAESAEFAIASPPQLTLLKPTGGERLMMGETFLIEWRSIGAVGAEVRIELLKNGLLYQIVDDATDNGGSYLWKIPESIEPGDDYQLRLMAVDDGLVFTESSGTFTIMKKPQLWVTSPQAGELWYKGTLHVIQWRSSGDVGANVQITLYRDSSFVMLITAETSNSGAYAWVLPTTLTPANDYRIVITSEQTAAESECFTIFEAPRITVTIPAGGETWIKGEEHLITWSHSGCGSSDVSIILNKGGQPWGVVSLQTSNSGAYCWQIPDSLATGHDFQIGIFLLSNPIVKEESGFFSIVDPEPTAVMLLTPPNGGPLGMDMEFSWSRVRYASSYRIQIDNDPTYSSPEVDRLVVDNAYKLDTFLPADIYYWHVRAINSSGESPWSASYYFWLGMTSVFPDQKNNLPEKFFLSRNFPNPFNDRTIFELHIPKATFAELKIVNIRGQTVAELVSRMLQPGFYQVIWDAREQRSGVYYALVQCEGFRAMQKIVLIK